MKKFIPYLLSVLVGVVFALFIFKSADFSIKDVFAENITTTAFQLGVFKTIETANDLKDKYPPSVIIQDDDVYRVYYSILTDNKTIKKMEDYLNNQKIAFYKKVLVINDKTFIEAINNYEKTILEGNDTVLTSVNKLIMNSYKGGI